MSAQAKPHVALLGTGVMGSGMGRRLLDAGVPLTVWNRRRERAQPLADAGATVADSPAAAVAHADVVVSMVADDAASLAVWTGPHGALTGVRPGTLLAESSTLSPPWILELAELARKHQCAFVDAPVTGSKVHAATGQLTFLVGGDADAVARIDPLLSVMGRGSIHLGPVGSGARMKLINNFMAGVQAVALAEALVLIERGGLDASAALPVLYDGAPGSPMVRTAGARMTAKDYSVNFQLALMRKDLGYAIAEGERHDLPLETVRGAFTQLSKAKATSWDDADFAAVVEVVRAGR
jgi:3-hydroxyisobutyrate dehydrogenase